MEKFVMKMQVVSSVLTQESMLVEFDLFYQSM